MVGRFRIFLRVGRRRLLSFESEKLQCAKRRLFHKLFFPISPLQREVFPHENRGDGLATQAVLRTNIKAEKTALKFYKLDTERMMFLRLPS